MKSNKTNISSKINEIFEKSRPKLIITDMLMSGFDGRTLTKEVKIEIQPENIKAEMINFLEANVKEHHGKTTLKFVIKDFDDQMKVGLYTLEKSFTMNDDMAIYLNNKTDIGVSVLTA